MNQHMDTRPWQRGNIETLGISFLVAYVGMFLAYLFVSISVSTSNTPVWPSMVGFGVIFAFSWFVNQPKRHTFSKQFLVNRGIAWQVVVNMLSEKGIPYSYKADRFELEGSNVVIQIESSGFNQFASACRIRIGPISTETLPLLNSLREKIDQAFLPRGLV